MAKTMISPFNPIYTIPSIPDKLTNDGGMSNLNWRQFLSMYILHPFLDHTKQ